MPIRGRVTNGQRAAVCALVLAGVPYSYACNIAGIRPKVLNGYLGKDWQRKVSPRKRWTDDQIAALAEVWQDPNIKTDQIAASFGICAAQVWKVAKGYGLGNRPTWKAINPRSIQQQPHDKQVWYRKLRKEFGAERARREIGL